MLSLATSEKFLKEYNEFKQKIDEITEDSIKHQLSAKLKELKSTVDAIDFYHSNLSFTNNPTSPTDTDKIKLQTLRKEISKKIELWEKQKK